MLLVRMCLPECRSVQGLVDDGRYHTTVIASPGLFLFCQVNRTLTAVLSLVSPRGGPSGGGSNCSRATGHRTVAGFTCVHLPHQADTTWSERAWTRATRLDGAVGDRPAGF